MDCSVYKDLGHFLLTYKTHLPWAKNFSLDNSIGRDIYYNGKGVPWHYSPPLAYRESSYVWDTHD